MKAGKLVAPILVTVMLLAILVGYGAACFFLPLPIWLRLVGLAVLLGAAGAAVFVLIERIREVRSGEEDDLSDY